MATGWKLISGEALFHVSIVWAAHSRCFGGWAGHYVDITWLAGESNLPPTVSILSQYPHTTLNLAPQSGLTWLPGAELSNECISNNMLKILDWNLSLLYRESSQFQNVLWNQLLDSLDVIFKSVTIGLQLPHENICLSLPPSPSHLVKGDGAVDSIELYSRVLWSGLTWRQQ